MTPFKADYDAIAEQWQQLRNSLPPEDDALFTRFVASLPSRARILDLGCGHGAPMAQRLAEAGHRLTGVDRSTKLLNEARARLPDHDWLLADLADFQPDDGYDAVILWDAIFHLPREQHTPLLRRIYSALQSGGQLLLTSGGSEQSIPAFSDIMFDHEFYYDAFPVNELLQHGRDIGFSITEHHLLNVPDGGRDKGRLGVRLRRS